MYSAKIIKDSISEYGHRLTTFEICFPRMVLADFNTHKMVSKNSSSSRAIPVAKQLQKIQDHPYVPFFWGLNQKGMQAEMQLTDTDLISKADNVWLSGRDEVVKVATNLMSNFNIHKQLTNRLLEAFMWHTVICTATDWDNFFALRANPQTQPELQKIAEMMLGLYKISEPTTLQEGQWHLPLVLDEEMQAEPEQPWQKISVGRCARVSYLTHDGKRDLQADIELCERLKEDGHQSPGEHAARPMTSQEYNELFSQNRYEWDEVNNKWINPQPTHYLGNFNGWVQYRKMIKNEHNFGLVRK